MLVLPKAERPFAKGPFLAMLIAVVATEPWRPDTYFDGGVDGVVVSKALLSVLAAVTAWLLIRNRPRLAVPAWPAVLIGLFLAVTVFGGWAADSFLASAVVAVRVAILVIIVYLLLSGYDGYSVIAGLVGALATVGVFSALTGGGRATDGRLAGGLPPLHPNELAAISAIVILWLVYRAVNGRESGVDLIALGLAGVVLVASGSRTSMVMLAPALLVLILSARRLHLRVLIPFLLALPVIAVGLLYTDAATAALTREGSSDDLLSLSNRTIAWQAALMPKGTDWLTWMGGGLTLKQIEVPGQWWSHQILDSSWVSALIQGGYLGMGIAVLLIAYGLYRVARVPGELRGFRLSLIAFLSLRGLLESGLFDASTAFLACFTALAMPGVARHRGSMAPSRQSPYTSISNRWLSSHATTPGGTMRSIKKRLIVAGNLLALGLLIAGLVNVFTPRTYVSSVDLYATAGGRQLRASDIYQGTMMVSARMTTYVELATSPIVLNAVIQDLQLDDSAQELAERVTAKSLSGTSVLSISATDADPEQAQQIAASVATHFSDSVRRLETGTGSPAQVEFKAVSPAQAPISPDSPHQWRNLAIGALIGGGLGVLTLLWPLARIASSPDGQLRVIMLGPLADRLDPRNVYILGEVESRPTEAENATPLPALTTGDRS